MKSKNLNKKIVFVGLSGGVDSAVSAYLLKRSGYKVVGAFIRTWQPEWLECTWKEERRDAMRVASHLQIPFVTIDLEKEYKKNVADYMISEYRLGRTPNPDVMCNKEIKFGAFLKKVLEMGADFVATGHYSQVKELKNNKFELLASKDKEKEQSYFLWTLKQEQLAKILFPIGDLKKTEVRRIAQSIHLPNAEKKDSQGICFLGDVDMKDFLSHYIETNKGIVLNEKGENIGIHDGAVFYTIGERHGFIVTKKTTDDVPLYVISKDLKNNTIIVGTKFDLEKESGKVAKKVLINNINWINDIPKEKKSYNAQIRYHQKYQKINLIKIRDNEWQVEFNEPQTSASGQSIVIYDKNICLGGGVIE